MTEHQLESFDSSLAAGHRKDSEQKKCQRTKVKLDQFLEAAGLAMADPAEDMLSQFKLAVPTCTLYMSDGLKAEQFPE